MLDNLFESKAIYEKALDAAWIRNKVIVHNIANIDTPGYKRKTVSFEDQLKQAMESGNFEKSDVDNIEIKINNDNQSLSMRLDGNNVDIDKEMVELAKNSIRYEALSKLVGYTKLKIAIDGK